MHPSRFLRPMRFLDGRRFHGVLLDEKSDVGIMPSNRLLVTRRPMQSRDLFRDPTDRVYLVAEHGAAGHYRVFEMDRRLAWVRMATVKDPVTGLSRNDVPTDLGLTWASLAPAGALTGALPADVPEYRILTGAQLAIGDRIGPYTVTRADTLVGITVAEVR